VHKIGAIPTLYRGIQMRSRLEAKYAILFDLLGLKWAYEAIDLNGAIPDFIVEVELFSRPQVSGPTLIEIRPLLTAPEYRETINKIARSGWQGSAMVLGATVREHDTPWGKEWSLGYGTAVVSPKDAEPGAYNWFPVGWCASGEAAGKFAWGGNFDITRMWADATNRSRWMPSR
jgi:hypothetical protein